MLDFEQVQALQVKAPFEFSDWCADGVRHGLMVPAVEPSIADVVFVLHVFTYQHIELIWQNGLVNFIWVHFN